MRISGPMAGRVGTASHYTKSLADTLFPRVRSVLFAVGPTNTRPRSAQRGEVGSLAEEAVSGVDGSTTSLVCHPKKALSIEVGLRPCRSKRPRLVALARMERVGVVGRTPRRRGVPGPRRLA